MTLLLDLSDDRDGASFKSKQKTIGQTENNGTKDVQILAPLNNLSILLENFRNVIN